MGGFVLILLLAMTCWAVFKFSELIQGTGTSATETAMVGTLVAAAVATDISVEETQSAHLTAGAPTDSPRSTSFRQPTLTPWPTNPPENQETVTPEPTSTPSLAPEEPPLLITDDIGVPMALVRAGPFLMGGDANVALAECQKFRDDCERSWFEDEEPVHTVTLSDFYIDQYEVTNALYEECVEDGICNHPSSNQSTSRDSYYGNSMFVDHPVIYVSWYDAQTYCQWRDARLPTEAEWEKAARAGLEGALYPWGDDSPVCESGIAYGAKFDDDAACNETDTVKVGSYGANGYGLYDMAGNVWEWTQSQYQDYPYDPTDGRNNIYSSGNYVLRGGSWYNYPNYLRVSARVFNAPSVTSNRLGFRCAKDAP